MNDAEWLDRVIKETKLLKVQAVWQFDEQQADPFHRNFTSKEFFSRLIRVLDREKLRYEFSQRLKKLIKEEPMGQEKQKQDKRPNDINIYRRVAIDNGDTTVVFEASGMTDEINQNVKITIGNTAIIVAVQQLQQAIRVFERPLSLL